MSNRLSANLANPTYWLREYIFAELKKYDDVGVAEDQAINPIIPASPVGQQDFYQGLIGITNDPNPILIQYERLLRFRTTPFYRLKKDQLILDFYSSDVDITNNAMNVVAQALDREDASAQEVNTWCKENATSFAMPHNVFFHKMRVFKIDESRDVLEWASVNNATQPGKMIIEYDYHVVDGPIFGMGNVENPYK